MKKYIVFTGLLAASVAHADWLPKVQSRIYTATVQVNGSTPLSYSENRLTNGPLTQVANDFAGTSYALEQGLNSYLAQEAASNGASFLSGVLTGSINTAIAPQASGTTLVTLSGLNYQLRTKFSGKKYGIISYQCVNTLTLNDFSVTAQYGTASGAIQSNTVGASATPTSNTDCDTNISWILPIVGNYVINKLTSNLDQKIVTGIIGSLGLIKDKLFYGRDQNYLIGLNKLIPLDKVVTLPNGSTFPIGQYIQNNLVYLLSNSQMTIKIDKGAVVKPVYGWSDPSDIIDDNVISVTITSPAVSFSVKLSEMAHVNWSWQCSISRPSEVCYIP